ncbi:DUF4124 domain-containing protein [Aquisalimonas asiatica]|uniref:DUF4124 domain-containing protein n=1 Tax=Aquisalimonas asiatica TaxID=406100 RepID=A0A1H8R1T5_9GAMM|nr:DUF4124 domain-containing protein [Aquisalimonas asiatica]SEO60104.1 protein of unknown function [Aquisalimonas asiatica]
MNRLIFTSLALLVATTASAGIYQWTDDDGHVHFGENPPPEVDAERLDGAPGPASQPEEPATDDDQADSGPSDEPAVEEESGADEEQPEGVLAEACEDARHNAEVYADESVRRVQTEDGDVQILEPEEREARLDEAQTFLDEHC